VITLRLAEAGEDPTSFTAVTWNRYVVRAVRPGIDSDVLVDTGFVTVSQVLPPSLEYWTM
jgi:hypothetical protein